MEKKVDEKVKKEGEIGLETKPIQKAHYHVPLMERPGNYEQFSLLTEAKNYYTFKYGALRGIPSSLQQSNKLSMVA
jgi:hypothetical protein